MKNELLPALRKELENSFGRKINTSRDCIQMVEDIYLKTGYSINSNTLRRFFGLVKSSYHPSPTTLSILLKYCGLNSIEELEGILVIRNTDSEINKDEILRYLVSAIKSLPVKDDYLPVIEPLIMQTVSFLERNPILIDRFQREIAESVSGQYYYFERSVNMDRLNSYYGIGLRYYQRSSNTPEASLFSNSIQVLRHWLSQNKRETEKYLAALPAIPVNNNLPVHIFGRYMAARLLGVNLKGEPAEKIISEASRYYASIITKKSKPFSDFELPMAEALILTNLYSEAIEYIRGGKLRLQGATENSARENLYGFWEEMINRKKADPLKAILTAGRSVVSKVIATSPLSKRYFSILSHQALGKTRSTGFSELIRETGFIRLA